MRSRLALVAVLLLALIGGAAASGGSNASASSNSSLNASVSPTSPFYGLHIAYDRVRLALTHNQEKRATLALGYANERLAEVELLASKGDVSRAKRVQKLGNLFLAKAEKAASVNGTNATGQYEHDISLEERLALHRTELERLRNLSQGNLTASQKAAIASILADSQSGVDNFSARLASRDAKLRDRIESEGGNATLARLDASRYQHLALVAQRQAALAIANAERLLAMANASASRNASAHLPPRAPPRGHEGPTGHAIDVNLSANASDGGANVSVNESGSSPDNGSSGGSGSESGSNSSGSESGSSGDNTSSEGSGVNGSSEGSGSEGGVNASLNSTESEGSGSSGENSSAGSSGGEHEAPENATLDRQARIDLEDGMTNATLSLLASYNLTLPAINGSGIAVGEAFVARAKAALATSKDAYTAKDYAKSYAYARFSHLLAVHAMWAARSHPVLAAQIGGVLERKLVVARDDLRSRIEQERARLGNGSNASPLGEGARNRTAAIRQQIQDRRANLTQRVQDARNAARGRRDNGSGAVPIPLPPVPAGASGHAGDN